MKLAACCWEAGLLSLLISLLIIKFFLHHCVCWKMHFFPLLDLFDCVSFLKRWILLRIVGFWLLLQCIDLCGVTCKGNWYQIGFLCLTWNMCFLLYDYEAKPLSLHLEIVNCSSRPRVYEHRLFVFWKDRIWAIRFIQNK